MLNARTTWLGYGRIERPRPAPAAGRSGPDGLTEPGRSRPDGAPPCRWIGAANGHPHEAIGCRCGLRAAEARGDARSRPPHGADRGC